MMKRFTFLGSFEKVSQFGEGSFNIMAVKFRKEEDRYSENTGPVFHFGVHLYTGAA